MDRRDSKVLRTMWQLSIKVQQKKNNRTVFFEVEGVSMFYHSRIKSYPTHCDVEATHGDTVQVNKWELTAEMQNICDAIIRREANGLVGG